MQTVLARHNGRILGSGPVTLVLAHGYGTDQSAWDRLLPWATRHFRVVLFDLAGCGPGGADLFDPRRHGSLYGFADDLVSLVETCCDRPCLYLGHSVSGMIGVLAAIARPDLFDRLLLLAGSPRYLNDPDSGYAGGFDQPALDGLYAAMAANFSTWVAGFAPLVVGVEHPALQEFSRTLFSMRPDIALAIARTIFQSDLRGIIGRLTVPAVILQPAEDMAVPLAVGQYLQKAWPGSTLDVIPTRGHLPHMTAADQVQAALERHLPLVDAGV